MKKKRQKFYIYSIGFIFVAVVVFYTFFYFCYTPQIILKEGSKYITGYQKNYKEPGYHAYYKGKDITSEVKVSGKVNSKKLGNYYITYSVGEGIFSKKVVRMVKVRDLEKPKLSFSDSGTIYSCPNQEFKSKKFVAIDNYDGDLTDQVKVTLKKEKVLYSVADSSGNYIVKQRKLLYKDKEAPALTMDGSDIITVYLGEDYEEPGYSAIDNCDGNLTSKVKVSGHVNTKKEGTYHLTYKISDQAKNETKLTRTIIVTERKQKGVIYLTFDDGPRMGTTNVILDILKEEGIKATFFVTGFGPDDLILREYQEGHTVALHSATHNYSYIYSSVDNYFEDLQSVHDRVYRITGYDSKIIRFPGGSSNTVSRHYSPGIMSELTREVLRRGYKYYDWNINSGDAGETTDPDVEYQNVISSLSMEKENIILMHDVKSHTRDALKQIIEYGKQNGYHFDRITEKTEILSQKVNN